MGPWGGADLRFISLQPDTSRSCKLQDYDGASAGPLLPSYRWYSFTDLGGMAR